MLNLVASNADSQSAHALVQFSSTPLTSSASRPRTARNRQGKRGERGSSMRSSSRLVKKGKFCHSSSASGRLAVGETSQLVRRANAPQTVAGQDANDEPQVPGALPTVGRARKAVTVACPRARERLRVAVKRSRDMVRPRWLLFILSDPATCKSGTWDPREPSISWTGPAERPSNRPSDSQHHLLSIIVLSLPSPHLPPLLEPRLSAFLYCSRSSLNSRLFFHYCTALCTAATIERPTPPFVLHCRRQHCAPDRSLLSTFDSVFIDPPPKANATSCTRQ